MAIAAVLFDAAETLFTTRGSVGEIYGYVARDFGCTEPFDDIHKSFVRQFKHSGPLSTGDEKGWWKDVVHRVFSEVGMVRDFDRFFDRVFDQFRDSRAWMLFPETRETLTALKTRGLRLGVISNFDSRVYSVMRDLKILDFFANVTISSETGFAKPDPEIFAAAIQKMDLPADRILLIGDSLRDDVLAGMRAGLNACLIDRADRHADAAVRRISSLTQVFSLL